MLAAAGVARLGGRARSPVAVLATAAGVVCVLDPWAPLAAGFWLSFAAVASIIWAGSVRGARPPHEPGRDGAGSPGGWRPRAARLLHEATRSQFAATLVLVPLGVVFFSSVSLVSPVANAFAIPLVSAVVTPLALVGAALAIAWVPAGAPLLRLSAWLAEMLLAALQWLDGLGTASLPMPWPGAAAVLLGALACALVLAPARFPGRWLAALGLCPVLFAPPRPPVPGEIRLTALDVGQGTAVLVETAQGRLLYDTGPALGPDSEAGSRVILPWLRAHGVDRLQAVVVSHEDLDHAGGALAVLRGVRVDWVSSSLAPEHPVVAAAPRHHPCVRGERWSWGEVRFEWLHPGPEPVRGAGAPPKARRCVLRVESAAGTALLAGDIEAAQERQLLGLFEPARLRADVLIAPHHGSRTSSTPAFLDAVAPAYAVFQVGYRNRYRHPNPQVLERYRTRGVEVLRSDAHAAIEIRMRPGEAPHVVRHRLDRPRWWRVPVDEDTTVPSSPRRWSRPRHGPAARRPSTGTPRAHRSARASRTPARAASRRAGSRAPRPG
jgi:competence protein ComEC